MGPLDGVLSILGGDSPAPAPNGGNAAGAAYLNDPKNRPAVMADMARIAAMRPDDGGAPAKKAKAAPADGALDGAISLLSSGAPAPSAATAAKTPAASASNPQTPLQAMQSKLTIGDLPGAAVEPIATMATGAIGSVVGGLTRLVKAGTGSDYDAAKATGDWVRDKMTYKPMTDGGKASIAGLADTTEKVKNALMTSPVGPAISAAGKAYDDTFVKGSSNPLMATINDQVPTILANVAGPTVVGKVVAPLRRGAAALGDNLLSKNLSDVPVADRVEPTLAKPRVKLNVDGTQTPVAGGNPLGQVPATPPAVAPGTASSATTFTVPALPQAKSVLSNAQQAQNLAVMSEIGLDSQRASAITGDKFMAGTEFQHSKLDSPMGETMRGQLTKEQSALKNYGQAIITETGAAASAPEAVGQAIRAPLQGLSEHYDNGIKSLYQAADAQAGGAATVQPTGFGKLIDTNSMFAGKAENASLRRGIRAYIKEQGIVGEDGTLQAMNVQQAEGLRQYLNSNWSPQNSGLIGKIKESLDMDVAKAGGEDIYAQARALHAERKNTLDNPNGIASLLNEKGPDGINKQVPDEGVAKKVLAMPTQQMSHVIDTLKNLPAHLQEQGKQAIAEIKGSLAKQIYAAGDSGGTQNGPSAWNAANVTRQLNAMDSKIKLVFTPDEIAKLKTLNDAGHILQTPSAYPGAAAQGHNLLQRGMIIAPPAAGAAIGHSIAGVYGASIGGTVGAGLSSKVANRIETMRANKLQQALDNPRVRGTK